MANKNITAYPVSRVFKPWLKSPLPERLTPSTVVLLGAGASADMGYPLGKDLVETLYQAQTQPLATVMDAFKRASQYGFPHDNFEELLSAMSAAAEQEVSRWLLTKAVGLALSADDFKAAHAQAITTIADNLGPPEEPWIPVDFLNWASGGTVFTLNFDTGLESAKGRMHNGLISLVRVRAPGDPRPPVAPAVISTNGPGPVEPPSIDKTLRSVRLIKLHGSIGWSYNQLYDAVFNEPSSEKNGLLPAIAVGAGNKLRHYPPFPALLAEFRSALEQADRLLLIGSSLQDRHITYEIDLWRFQTNAEVIQIVNGPAWKMSKGLAERWRTPNGPLVQIEDLTFADLDWVLGSQRQDRIQPI